MKKLLLVEDDSSLGTTLQERLEKSGYSVVWKKKISDARAEMQNQKFDLMILDVGLPDGDGFQFAEEMKAKQPIPFIFVTAQNSADDRMRGYDLGAHEFIPKPFHLRELLLRVHHVLEDHSELQKVKFGDVEIDFEARKVQVNGQVETVAGKELDILRLLIQKSPRVLSRDEILDSIWGKEEFPSHRTVDNMISRLRQILGTNVGSYVQSVRSVGYQWLPPKEN